MNAIPDASTLAVWRKSSHSNNGEGACVEVADGYPGGVPVRDSKAPHGPALVFPPPAGRCSSPRSGAGICAAEPLPASGAAYVPEAARAFHFVMM